MTVAVKASTRKPRIPCLAHRINLTAKWGTGVNQVSKLLGCVWKIVAFFHMRNVATDILKKKAEFLEIAEPTGPNTLVIDAATRWNRSYDMFEHYRKNVVL